MYFFSITIYMSCFFVDSGFHERKCIFAYFNATKMKMTLQKILSIAVNEIKKIKKQNSCKIPKLLLLKILR